MREDRTRVAFYRYGRRFAIPGHDLAKITNSYALHGGGIEGAALAGRLPTCIFFRPLVTPTAITDRIPSGAHDGFSVRLSGDSLSQLVVHFLSAPSAS